VLWGDHGHNRTTDGSNGKLWTGELGFSEDVLVPGRDVGMVWVKKRKDPGAKGVLKRATREPDLVNWWLGKAGLRRE